MKTKTLLVNVEMARAIQDEIKTQTRRIIKSKGSLISFDTYAEEYNKEGHFIKRHNPKYKVDDTIWLREPAKVSDLNISIDDIGSEAHIYCRYISDNKLKVIKVPERFNNNDSFPKVIVNINGCPLLVVDLNMLVSF